MRVVAGGTIGLVVPDIAGIRARDGKLGGGRLPHADRRIGHATATSGIVANHLIVACHSNGEGVVRSAVAPQVTVAAVGCKGRAFTRADVGRACDGDDGRLRHKYRDVGRIAAACSGGSCDGVNAKRADADRCRVVARGPAVTVCAGSSQGSAVARAKCRVARDVDAGCRIDSNRNICYGGTALRVGGGNCIYTILAHTDTIVGAGIAPKVRNTAVSGECGGLALAQRGAARNGWGGQRFQRESECQHAVASVDCLQRVRVGARSGEVLSVEIVTLALADAVRKRDVVGRIHRNRGAGEGRTTIRVIYYDGVDVGVTYSDSGTGVSVAPLVTE